MKEYLIVFNSGLKVTIKADEIKGAPLSAKTPYVFMKDGKEIRDFVIQASSIAAIIPVEYLKEPQTQY